MSFPHRIFSTNKIAKLTQITTLVFATLSFFVPQPAVGYPVILFLMALSISASFAILYIGGSTLFLASLSKFKAKLRIAYITISVGMLTLAGAQLLAPLATLFNWWGQDWLQSLQGMAYMLAAIFVYAGIRGFARLLQVKSLARSFIFGIVASIPLCYAASWLPHIPLSIPEAQFDYTIMGGAFMIWLFALATWLVLQIKRQASPMYAPPMTWLFWSLNALNAGLIGFLVLQLTSPPLSWGLGHTILLLPYLVSGVLFVEAATNFYAISQWAIIELPDAQKLVSSIDIVIYTAGLASIPRDVEPIMNKVRLITAKLKLGEELTTQQQATFMKTYTDLEQYLVEHDPARKYSRGPIRELITRSLSGGQSHTFWLMLKALE